MHVNTPKIVSIGEVLWDVFPDRKCFGGAPANFACHAAIQGAHIAVVSAVGADQHGRDAIEMMRRFDIDIRCVDTVRNAPTGTVSVNVDSAGKPSFIIHENSAWDYIKWTSQVETLVEATDAIYFGTLGQRSKLSRDTLSQSLEIARTTNTLRLVDINLREPFYDREIIRQSLGFANLLKLSNDELPMVLSACGIASDTSIEKQLCCLRDQYSLDLIVMTCGEEGAILITPDAVISQHATPTTLKDTVGAGDSFAAAFLLGVLRGHSYEQVLGKACDVAAATCSHVGAVPKIESKGLGRPASVTD